MKTRLLWAAMAAAVLLAVLCLFPTLHAAVPTGDLPPLVTRPGTVREISPDALDLNTATLEQLQALPAIGPVRAQNILDYRAQNGPFQSPEELAAVEDIGPGTLEKVRALICVTQQEEQP